MTTMTYVAIAVAILVTCVAVYLGWRDRQRPGDSDGGGD